MNNLISSGEFLEACFDKIDEFRQRDTSQLAAGLFIFVDKKHIVFFESDIKLLPGTVVFIFSDGDSKYCRAEVKWPEKLNQAGTERYGIGAEYIDPP
jgi:hypothetical protein